MEIRSSRFAEDPETACNVLIHLIKDRPEMQRQLLFRDLASRLPEVRPEAKLALILDLLSEYAPEEVRMYIKKKIRPDISPKPKGDIIFLTVKPRELMAAKCALEISQDKDEDGTFSGYRFWQRSLEDSKTGCTRQIILTMVGVEGALNCSNACRTIASNLDVSIFILIGMAAGVRQKVDLGDIVFVQEIIDYEAARKEPNGDVKKPEPFKVNRELRRDFQYFLLKPDICWNNLSSGIKLLKTDLGIPDMIDSKWRPRILEGVMLSGAKLVADGTIPSMRKEFHEKCRILDMEGSGFADACEELHIPWLAFKGVADFGDPQSKDQSETKEADPKIWQGLASLAATTATINFLKSDYMKGR